MTLTARGRWLALYVLCLGDLMIVLDGTIERRPAHDQDDLGFRDLARLDRERLP